MEIELARVFLCAYPICLPDKTKRYQQKDDHLSEKRPVSSGVIYNQPRHTGSGGGSKERLQKGRIEMGSAGDRQHKQKSADQNQGRKAQNNRLKIVDLKTSHSYAVSY